MKPCSKSLQFIVIYTENFLIHYNMCLQVSIFFDLLFMCQHYILYPAKKRVTNAAPLLEPVTPEPKSVNPPHSEENV